MMMANLWSQLQLDGFIAASNAISEVTLIPPFKIDADNSDQADRLWKLVQLGLQKEREMKGPEEGNEVKM